jgi:beta-mannosidase
MFIPHRISVRGLLRAGDNELQFLFESALRRGKEDEARHGVRRIWNGNARKAQ